MSKKRVALVIGSGSVKCAAALGLQNVLTRAGVQVDMYVGCSGGSLYAASLAMGNDTTRTADWSGGSGREMSSPTMLDQAKTSSPAPRAYRGRGDGLVTKCRKPKIFYNKLRLSIWLSRDAVFDFE